MINSRKILPVLVLSTGIWACKSSKVAVNEGDVWLDTLSVVAEHRPEYRASKTKYIDITHTKLDLSFYWDSAFVLGKAYLSIRPYAKTISSFKLDAKGFRINQIGLKVGDSINDLQYTYDDGIIDIQLKEALQPEDSILLFVDYVAMPEKLTSGGSDAITDDRGLYFINYDESDPNKPRQLWTQGETEANSCWFPTFDSPNEKFTTEIYLHIEENYTSISNGHLMFSVDEGNGMKTDYWKMDQPHSAYLVMLAIGPFSVQEDDWNDLQVNYYVDSTYLPYAQKIFGNTPEMLTFYSEYLGVPYPWQKYDQVVVHDYVSGAMENTTAVIHGDFVQQTDRELLDYNHEDIIAHELFHHWFGDLVTCESWSNLTLNEGFATYGEYLWDEYKNGRSEADYNFNNTLRAYLQESEYKNVDLIRFHYDDKEDMFDSHSYSKGGRVLHMLRNYLGDDIFRKGLKHYLTKHAYQTAEVHDLRIAFEEVSGEDLNWFFNQWFLASGHPDLTVNYEMTDSLTLEIRASQNQDLEEFPLYKLPVNLLISTEKGMREEMIWIEQEADTFQFELNAGIQYLIFDKGKVLLAESSVLQDQEAWIQIAREAELYIDRHEAFNNLEEMESEALYALHKEALSDSFHGIRSKGLNYFNKYLVKNEDSSIVGNLENIAKEDEDNFLRAMAIGMLNRHFDRPEHKELFAQGIEDSSYSVVSASFKALSNRDAERAMQEAKRFESETDENIILTLSSLYVEHGTADNHAYFLKQTNHSWGYGKYQFLMQYGKYLEGQENAVMEEALPYFQKVALEDKAWWNRLAAIASLNGMMIKLNESMLNQEKVLSDMKEDNPNRTAVQADFDKTQSLYKAVDKIWLEIKETETNPRLISVISQYDLGIDPFEN